MKVDLVGLLKATSIFSSLDEEILKNLLNKFEKVYLQKKDILFRQGELSNSIYVLVAGKIALLFKDENNHQQILTEITPGDTIGELSALSLEPRPVTAKALQEAIVLKLPNSIFFEIGRTYPEVFHQTINMLMGRSHKMIENMGKRRAPKKHVAIIPANKKTSLSVFADKITGLAANLSGIVVLSDYDNQLRDKFKTAGQLRQEIRNLEKQHVTILYLLESYKSMLAKCCFEKAEMFYIVAQGGAKPFLNQFVVEKIADNNVLYNTKSELILLHEQVEQLPKFTAKWLRLAHFGLHHHVRINQEKDCQRILRFMSGRAVGLVLGGGGVRGWAHIGAIKALLESDIPIDAIGGTSGGAIMAGYYALHETYEDSHTELHKLSVITHKAIALKNLTWPAVSLFNGKAYTETQMQIYGKAKVNDLWLPYFSVACNLSRNIQVIHRSGYLWKAIRSSTAVPAIFPPVVIKGEMHLDGGILNNLPVDVMRKLTPGIGTVIAVDLTRNTIDETEYNFPSMMPFWPTVLAKLKLAHKEYKFPHFVETFLKSLLAGSSAKQEENARTADILISPNLSRYGLLTLKAAQENELIELGYKAAHDAIKNWQQKNNK